MRLILFKFQINLFLRKIELWLVKNEKGIEYTFMSECLAFCGEFNFSVPLIEYYQESFSNEKLQKWLVQYATFLKINKATFDNFAYLDKLLDNVICSSFGVQEYFESDLFKQLTNEQKKELVVIYLYMWNCISHSYANFMAHREDLNKIITLSESDTSTFNKLEEITIITHKLRTLTSSVVSIAALVADETSGKVFEFQQKQEYTPAELQTMIYDICSMVAIKYGEEDVFTDLERVKCIIYKKMDVEDESNNEPQDEPNKMDIDEIEDECGICYDEIVNKVTLVCDHSYCNDCIMGWKNSDASDHNLCPFCRKTIVIKTNETKPKPKIVFCDHNPLLKIDKEYTGPTYNKSVYNQARTTEDDVKLFEGILKYLAIEQNGEFYPTTKKYLPKKEAPANSDYNPYNPIKDVEYYKNINVKRDNLENKYYDNINKEKLDDLNQKKMDNLSTHNSKKTEKKSTKKENKINRGKRKKQDHYKKQERGKKQDRDKCSVM